MKTGIALFVLGCAATSLAQTAVPLSSGGGKTGGEFGRRIAGVPDVNGDGRGDILVGARREGPGTSRRGAAYLYSGANGSLLRTLVSPNPESDGQFGTAVSGIADINGDGRGDLIVGAPDEDPGSSPEDAGRVYVFSGANGVLLRTLAAPNQETDGEFGEAVGSVPDLTGDGVADIVVGAPYMDPGAAPNDSGRAFVFSGANGAFVRMLASPTPAIGGNFGDAVAGIGDINGDGRGDVLVAAPSELGGGVANSGVVHVFSGASGARIRSLISPGRELGGRFGESLSAVPDVNLDGRPDIVVGAPHEDPGTSPIDNGRAYVYSGATGVLLWKLLPPSPTDGDDFGDAVAGLPDLNGDGRGDIAVGAQEEDPGLAPHNSGRVHVYSGGTGKRLFTLASPNQTDDGRFGVSVASVPDTNGNGRADIAVGADGEGGLTDTGRAYLFRR